MASDPRISAGFRFMITANFDYHRPATLAEALSLLGQHGAEAKLLAGGHSLIPMMKFRLAQPGHLIDIRRLSELQGIRLEEDRIIIGAAATHAQIEASALLRKKCPLAVQTAASIGDVQVRNLGTIGGSVAHADPAADWPAAMLALEVGFMLAGPGGERTVAAEEFFVDVMTTALQPDEILKAIHVPSLASSSGTAYVKHAQKASGFALCGAAAVITRGKGKGKIARARVALTGVAAKPFRARAVEAALEQGKPAAEAAMAAGEGIEFLSDLHASAEYRKQLAVVSVRRAIELAAG